MHSDKGPWKDADIMKVGLQSLFVFLFLCIQLINILCSVIGLQVYVLNIYLYGLTDGSKW